MATHSSILAWEIPWGEKPGGLHSGGLQRVRHDWSDLAHTQLFFIKTTGVLGGTVIEEDGISLVCLQGDYAWQLVTHHNFLLAILGLEMNLLLLKCLLCLPYLRKAAPERSLLIGSGIGVISLDCSESSMRGWS